MTATPVALALGSNLGDRMAALSGALAALEAHVAVDAVSSVYESAAVGGPDGQPDFLNAVAIGGTELEPGRLLDAVLDIEGRAGRRRTVPKAPRVLDVDIVLYGGLTLTRPDHAAERRGGLCIPHPRWKERSFVLAPLAEVAPDWTDPVTGRTVLELWTERRDDLPPVRVVASSHALLTGSD